MIELDPHVEQHLHRAIPYAKSPFGIRTLIADAKKVLHIHSHPISDDDAYAIGGKIADQWISDGESIVSANTSTVDKRRVNPEWKYFYEHIDHEIQSGREAANRAINTLEIPHETKRYLREIMDETEFITDRTYFGASYAYQDENENNIILLPIPGITDASLQIVWTFHQESPFDVIDGVLSHAIGHELGHIVDISLGSPSEEFASQFMSDYPMRGNNPTEDEQSLLNYLVSQISGERFAEYFGQDVFSGLGFRSTILNDFIRTYAVEFHGDGMTFNELSRVFDCVRIRLCDDYKEYDEVKQNKALEVLTGYLRRLYLDLSIYTQYPYSRDTVTKMIRSGWEKKTQ